MDFVYQYRTSDNAIHEGRVSASDRETAFRVLRSRGVKPMKLAAAPGFINMLLGRGKRWIAIALLVLVSVSLLCIVVADRTELRYACEERAQVFADPSALQKLISDGWSSIGGPGDAWFARHARPGCLCQCLDTDFPQIDEVPVPVYRGDSDEIAKMKRMVNRMKKEYADYVGAGGDVRDYQILCCRRLLIEKNIYDNIAAEIARLSQSLDGENKAAIVREWERKNVSLKSMGLRTIPLPELAE